MTIKNRKYVVEQLAAILIGFNEQLRDFQTDVYAYYDKRSGEVRLELYENPGGNGWRDDDHVTIYRDRDHFGDVLDNYFSFDMIVNAVEIEKNELISRAAEFFEIDPDEVWFWHVADYIRSDDDLIEKVNSEWHDHLVDIRCEFLETADEIIFEYENLLDEQPDQFLSIENAFVDWEKTLEDN